MYKRMKKKATDFNEGLVDDFSLEQTLQSYLGLLTHCSGYEVGQDLENRIWLEKTVTRLGRNLLLE